MHKMITVPCFLTPSLPNISLTSKEADDIHLGARSFGIPIDVQRMQMVGLNDISRCLTI